MKEWKEPIRWRRTPSSSLCSIPEEEAISTIASANSNRLGDSSRVQVHSMYLADKQGDWGLYTGTVIGITNLPTGFGVLKYDNGREYQGFWQYGKWHQTGRLLNPNGDVYEGQFVYDKRHGKGVYTWSEGHVYKGDFYDDCRQGQGTLCFSNGNVYTGQFANGSFEGHGDYTFQGGRYTGEFQADAYHGYGRLVQNGTVYVGQFANGQKHGSGEERDARDGRLLAHGIWEGGVLQKSCTSADSETANVLGIQSH